MRKVKDKQGQFIIIAALLIATMIISASAVMFTAVTYFKHERWEEYIIVINGVKAGTANVLKLSLANYTKTWNSSVLKTNLDYWRLDVKKAYSGFGAILDYSLANRSYAAYGISSINYYQGLAYSWNQRVSFSAANASAGLNITSVGLTGYRFTSTVFLEMYVADVLWYKGQGNNPGQVGVRVVMYVEGPVFLTNLQPSNFVLFQIGNPGVNQTFSLVRYYESYGHGGNPALNAYVYELRYQSQNDPVSVTATIGVVDARGIKVTGRATLNTVSA